MAELTAIDFSDIKAGDTIRTIRKSDGLLTTIEGVVSQQDSDGDWLNDQDDLITYSDGYAETYFLVRGDLPEDPGSYITFGSTTSDSPVFAVKMYGGAGWLASVPDGSYGVFSDTYIGNKDWALIR
jgi:hypothetical protein